MEVLFNLQNWEIEIIFLCMLGSQSMFCKEKVWEGVESEVESVRVIGRPDPLLIIMSSKPLYGIWIDRLFKSVITWYDAPLLRSQLKFSKTVVMARFAHGCQSYGGQGCHYWGGRGCHCCYGREAGVKVGVNVNNQ